MIKIIGVRFRNVGKIYYFNPMDLDIKRGDHVIVETARGLEFGKVILPPHEVTDDSVTQPLRETIRIATEEDEDREAWNRRQEKEAYRICQKKIREHGLEMKLIDAEYTFDNNKVLFYFTADGRVDFRELVKDLAGVFRTRIELRQIGVRDETKILGGIGICGRPLCCSIYLSEFAPVSIKMAKEQNLSLNPTKISGTCGRLMCCLKNEQDTYEYLNKKMPKLGDTAITPTGEEGEVAGINILRQNVRVLLENGEEKQIVEYAVDDLELIPKSKKKRSKAEGKGREEAGPAEEQEARESRPEKKKKEKKEKKTERPAEKTAGKNPEKNTEKGRNPKKSRERSQSRDHEVGRENGRREDRMQSGSADREKNSRDHEQRRRRPHKNGEKDAQGKSNAQNRQSGGEQAQQTGEGGRDRRRFHRRNRGHQKQTEKTEA